MRHFSMGATDCFRGTRASQPVKPMPWLRMLIAGTHSVSE